MAEQLMSELWVDEKLMAVFAKVCACRAWHPTIVQRPCCRERLRCPWCSSVIHL